MKKAYMELPLLTEEQFNELKAMSMTEAQWKEAGEPEINMLKKVQEFVPGAQSYWTNFAYDGKVFHIDSDDRRFVELTMPDYKLNPIVSELPTAEAIVKVVEVSTGIAESFVLKALALVAHRDAAVNWSPKD